MEEKGTGASCLIEGSSGHVMEENKRESSKDIDRVCILESQLYLMRGGLGLTEPPEDDEWERSKEIYLMNSEFSVLPKNPGCPILKSLYLHGNSKLRKMPLSFFDNMPALEVLNLSRTRIKSLPDSLFRLVNLRRLFVNHCDLLNELSPQIGQLKNLEVLDLEGTKIKFLPEEVQQLERLTCLAVSFCEPTYHGRSKLSEALIPQGTISALSKLEELNVDVSPDDDRWNAKVKSLVSEVVGSATLNALKLYFPTVELLSVPACDREVIMTFPTWLAWRSIASPRFLHFRFTVGHDVKRIIPRLPCEAGLELERNDKCLKYVNGVGEIVPQNIKRVLRYATAFYLDRHTNIKKLSAFGTENMVQLECCVLGECNELQTVIDDNDKIVNGCLASLQYLYIYRMKNLKSILKGQVRAFGFYSLKSLSLCTCPKLTFILSPELLQSLLSLEELTVHNCSGIISLVSCRNSESITSYFLPSLRRLSLRHLPELVSISNGFSISPLLEWLGIYYCSNLKDLPINKHVHVNLRKIEGEMSWWEALAWDGGQQFYWDDIFVPVDGCQKEGTKDKVTESRSTTAICHGDSLHSKGWHMEVNEVTESSLQWSSNPFAMAPLVPIQALPETPSLQLIFNKKLLVPIFTENKIVNAEGAPLQILLVNTIGDQVVPASLPHPIKVELVVLDGNFPSNDCNTWTSEQFNNSILRERTGKWPLLIGCCLTVVVGGVAAFGNLEFTDNSSWLIRGKLRFGARVAPGSYQGVKIREAITETCVVEDPPKELYKKHHPPRLEDEVWCLEMISEDGSFHHRLAAENIYTVQDFLKLSVVYPQELRRILGLSMSDKMWEVLIRHARTCDMGNEYYILRVPDGTITFNPICEIVNTTIRDVPSIDGDNYLKRMTEQAYLNWSFLEEVVGVSGKTPLITQVYKKHYPPSLEDEVWRLEKIAKDGSFHKKLAAQNINTVQDFLKLSIVYPQTLRKILRISNIMLEVLIKHARTCDMGNKYYILRVPDGTITFNPICEIVYTTIRDVPSIDRVNYLERMTKQAYLNWSSLEEVVGVSGETSLLTQDYKSPASDAKISSTTCNIQLSWRTRV